MAALGWRATFTPSRRSLAFGASLLLHAAVAFAVSRVPWSASVPEVGRPIGAHLVFVSERPPEPRADVVPEPLPLEPRPENVPPAPEPPAEEPATVDDAPAPELAPAPESGSSAEASAGERPRRNYLVPGVDWEEERRRAIARALTDLQRERRTFSNDPFGGDEPADEAANPREDLFSGGSRGGRGASRQGLVVGQSRSRFLNRVAEVCNALTGGLGLSFQGFSLGSICTEPGPTADFFADLRPDYMNSLPECAETEELELSPLAIERRDEFPTVKCRLVLQDP